MGQFFIFFREQGGATVRRWVEEVPNDGLIRYLSIFNTEQIAVVSPAALADVLVHNCYDFEKPALLKKGISRILGLGLIMAEGDVHKVSPPCASPVTPNDVSRRNAET